MKKRLSAIFIVMLLCVSVVVVPLDKTAVVSASASDWAAGPIEKAKKIALIDENYSFDANITRELFGELIYRYCSLFSNKSNDVPKVQPFTDTDNEHIAQLSALGIIHGKSELEFAPKDLLTREEAATILLRLIDTVYPNQAAHELYFEFADNHEISEWAMDSIQRICNMGIMNGVGQGLFSPKENFTVEQAIVTLVRIYEQMNEENSVIGGADEKTEIVLSDLMFADKLNLQMPTDQNYVFSPLSIKMALALAANGAEGTTRSEILNAVAIDDLDTFNGRVKEWLEKYSKTEVLSVNVANSIWLNGDKTEQNFSDDFKKKLANYYSADAYVADDTNAVAKINSWVTDKSNGKITQIVQSTDDFWAMLVNAIYFQGAWENEFDVRATKSDTFFCADGTETQMDFMNQTAWMNYAETQSVKMVELPYQNRVDRFDENGEYVGSEHYTDLDVSMYLIASDREINVAEELEAAVANQAFERTYLKLSVPKFKITYSENIDNLLKGMGIQTAYSPSAAQFEKMFDSGNMWFTGTIHKTFLSVDEKGTEAAAVTAIGMAGSAMPPEPTELKFNTPFYFVIRDNASGEVLFMGRYAYDK